MTKEKAIEAMKQGKKVCHKYFTPDEWISSDATGQIINTEQGYRHKASEFWQFRSAAYFDEGWEIVN